MSSNKDSKNAELRQYLKEKADGVMQEQILQLLSERPDDVYQFINNWADKRLKNEKGSEAIITDEIRKSMPKMVYPEDK